MHARGVAHAERILKWSVAGRWRASTHIITVPRDASGTRTHIHTNARVRFHDNDDNLIIVILCARDNVIWRNVWRMKNELSATISCSGLCTGPMTPSCTEVVIVVVATVLINIQTHFLDVFLPAPASRDDNNNNIVYTNRVQRWPEWVRYRTTTNDIEPTLFPIFELYDNVHGRSHNPRRCSYCGRYPSSHWRSPVLGTTRVFQVLLVSRIIQELLVSPLYVSLMIELPIKLL